MKHDETVARVAPHSRMIFVTHPRFSAASSVTATPGSATRRHEHQHLWSSPPSRRTKADIDAIRGATYFALEADHPMTVRQVFYRLVTQGAIGKTEAEYKHTGCRLLTTLRLDGSIPFGWIADNTRWMRKPTSYTGLQ